MSSLVTPTEVIAVYDIPESHLGNGIAQKNLVLALDGIQDPGISVLSYVFPTGSAYATYYAGQGLLTVTVRK